MSETATTRRRVVRGAGVIGFASLAGSGVVTAQDGGGGGGDDQGAAFRVAHASPDAPNVDVSLNAAGGDGGAGGTDGTETPGGGDGGDTQIEGLEFQEVSSYNELDPGTYQVQVRVTDDEGVLGGILDDLFGDDEDEGTVVFDEEVDVEEGTTYTAVAFGEVSRGPASTEDGQGNGAGDGQGTETGVGDQESTGQAFQVEILEDDITSPGEDTSRIRLFHAVPDVETVSVSTAGAQGTGTGGGQGTETAGGQGTETGFGQGDDDESDGLGGDDAQGGGETLVEELSFGESESVELQSGAYNLQVRATGGAQTGEAGGDDETDGGMGAGTPGPQGDEGVRVAEISPEGDATYSAFATGYFQPQAADAGGGQADGNETGGGEDDGAGAGTGDNESDTGGDGTDVAEGVQDANFELVTVQDSSGGERSDGGTGGLLRVGSRSNP